MKRKVIKLVAYQDDSGEWRWRAVARNGRIMADSAEGYKTKRGVEKAIDTFLLADLWTNDEEEVFRVRNPRDY